MLRKVENGIVTLGKPMALKQEQIVEVVLGNRMRLVAYIRSIVRDFHAAEDLYQKACLLAVQSSEKFNDTQHLVHWIWVVCRCESLKYIKQQKNHPVIFDEHTLEMIQTESQKTSLWDDPEIYPALEKCMSKLSSPVKLLLQKRYQDNMTCPRLAEVLNRNVKTVYVTLSRVHRQLYECVHKQIKFLGMR
jgi:RNA polymerase sigma-70 factor (ECF subfamily)